MTAITTTLLKELRNNISAPLSDCKKALESSDGNIEQAMIWLRKRGLAIADKKAGRETENGVIAVQVSGNSAVMLELNSETDFVARNDKFHDLCNKLLKASSGFSGDVEAFLSHKYDADRTVKELLAEYIGVIGENLVLRRMEHISTEQGKGAVVNYVHNQLTDGIGQIGVLVSLESEAPKEVLEAVGKDIAMHIAATVPKAVNIEDLDKTFLEKEKALTRSKIAESFKGPEDKLDSIVEKRVPDIYKEHVLLEQSFIKDPKLTVRQMLEAKAKENGKTISVKAYVRYTVGE